MSLIKWFEKCDEDNKTYLYIADELGEYELSTEAMLPYPNLVKALKTIESTYPVLTMKFDVSDLQWIKGIDLLFKFANTMKDKFEQFTAKKSALDNTIADHIERYTKHKVIPKVEYLKQGVTRFGYESYATLTLDGNDYTIQYSRYDDEKDAYYKDDRYEDKTFFNRLSLFWLLDCRDAYEIQCLGFIEDTPLLQVKYRENSDNKGRERWIDLHKREFLNKRDAFQRAKNDYNKNMMTITPIEPANT